jgi:hypothetical protein
MEALTRHGALVVSGSVLTGLLTDFATEAAITLIRRSRKQQYQLLRRKMERVKGIEPSYSAWKAAALPLSYTRSRSDSSLFGRAITSSALFSLADRRIL